MLPKDAPTEGYHRIVKEYSNIQSALQKKFSEFGICPVVNCIYHNNTQTNQKISSKRNRTSSSKSDKSKLSKSHVNQKPVDESDFKFPSKKAYCENKH
ncbi:hypothetical protein AVEN_239647-1 [Araneus ventricosus]|uniref:Uncharacterized protein n=1 Tax=Araneus ventricosus TaxID=182803 RepID=A0A4Y2CSN0_ARAVE|nr:hypothetical protein AVEN_239647-1 [Araneus ventricosus]